MNVWVYVGYIVASAIRLCGLFLPGALSVKGVYAYSHRDDGVYGGYFSAKEISASPLNRLRQIVAIAYGDKGWHIHIFQGIDS